MATLTNTALQSNPNVKLIASGKVREIYELTREPHHLLFVTTDRISAFDVILASGIKHRGTPWPDFRYLDSRKLNEISRSYTHAYEQVLV